MADGGTRPISELKVGAAVVATDPESGETTHEEVEFLHDNVDHDLVELAVTLTDGSTSTIQTTAEHPFWDDTEKAWTNAASLKPGTSLRTPDNKTDVTVSTAATFLGVRHMLNLTVANIHTYYVLAGKTPVLVHNCGEIPWTSGRVSSASRAIDQGATKINVGSRAEAEELFLGKFQGEGYRNASGFDGVGTKQYFGEKRGTYHWDDQVGADGRVLGHGAGNVDGALPHLQVHTFDGPIVRIFWGG